MKKLTFIVATVLFLSGLSSVTFAQTAKTSDVKSIDAYCNTVDAVRKKRKTAELVFADTADIESDKEKWQSFASEKALEAFRKKTETYTIAYNWRNAGKIVASNFTLFSPSGDWVKYVYHYYRADGSLARVESDYRTFNGDFMVVRRRYFDTTGKQLTQSVKYLDLKTQKPKKAPDGVMGDDPDEVDYYLTTVKLPFAHLLKK